MPSNTEVVVQDAFCVFGSLVHGSFDGGIPLPSCWRCDAQVCADGRSVPMRTQHDAETLRSVVPLPHLGIGRSARNAEIRNVLAQEIVAILFIFMVQYQRESFRCIFVGSDDQIECIL